MISYIGGKAKMSDWIGKFIPENIDTYVEVFGGAFWVYINGRIHERKSLDRIIYNDFNKFMVNLFECCRSPEEFSFRIRKIKDQDPLRFRTFQDHINKIKEEEFEIGNFDLAIMYSYLATQVFSGSKIMESKFIDLKGKHISKFSTFRKRLGSEKVRNKLRKITKCENLDYSDLIKKYDTPGTFFYVDPPYWKTENYYSNHEFDRGDHEKLCKQLSRIKGKFALSYYDFDLLDQWLPRDQYSWERKAYSKCAAAKKGKKQNRGVEVLIMNYKNKQLKLFTN